MTTDRRFVFLALGLAGLAACGGTKPPLTNPTWTVDYSLTVTGTVGIDSVQYDNGFGHLVTVTHPFPGSIASLAPTPTFTVQAKAWVRMAASSKATLKMEWAHTGVSYAADSLVHQTAGSPDTAVVLLLPQHTITQ